MLETVGSNLMAGAPEPRGKQRRIALIRWYREAAVDVLWVLSPLVHPWAEMAGLDGHVVREALRARGLLRDPWAILSPAARTDMGGRPSLVDDLDRDRELVAVLRRLEGD